MKYSSAAVVALIALLPLRANAGDLLLAAHGADAIYRYDGVSATLFASDPAMDAPTAMVYDAGGNVLVLSEFSTNVLRFNGTTGAFMGTFIAPATLAGIAGITDPDDMEMGTDGNLYIASHFNSPGPNVAKFDGATGAYLGPFASSLPTRHQHGLAFKPGGNLFQGNVDAGLVDQFHSITGAYMGTFTAAPVGPIADLAFGPGNLYVTTSGGSGVARYSSVSGTFLGYLATTPGAPYWGIVVDGPDLYVSNLGGGALVRFDAATGAFISSTPIGGGAFDILPMVPEPAGLTVSLILLAGGAAARRRAPART